MVKYVKVLFKYFPSDPSVLNLKYFLTGICMGFYIHATAQQSKVIDSLKQELEKELSIPKKITLLDKITSRFGRSDVDSILFYKEKIKNLAVINNSIRGEALVSYYQGMYYFYTSDYQKAIPNFKESVQKCKQADDKKKLCDGLNLLAGCHYQMGDYFKTIEYLDKSIEIAYEMNFNTQICTGLTNISNVYHQLENYDKAIEQIKKCQALGFCDNIYYQLDILANSYLNKKNFDEALVYAKKMDSLNRVEKDAHIEANLYLIYGNIFKGRNHIDKALESYIQAYEIYSNQKATYIENEADVLLEIADIYFKKKNIEAAKRNAKLSYDISENATLTANIYKSSKLLYKIYKYEQNNAKAFFYLNKALKYKDSINRVNSVNAIYQKLIRSEQEKVQLEEDAELRLEEIRNNGQILWFLIGGVLVAALIYSYNNHKLKIAKNQARYSLEKRLKLEQQIVAVEKNMATNFKENFSNVHNLIKSFSFLKKLIAQNTKKKNLLFLKHFSKIESNLSLLVNDMDDMLWASDIENNSVKSLILKIQQIVKTFNAKSQKRIVFTYSQDQQYILPKFANKQFLFILKEIINNFDKHAYTNKLHITLAVKHHALNINAKDEGKGADIEDFSRINGLSNIEKRAKTIGFSVNFQSKENIGSEISISGTLSHTDEK